MELDARGEGRRVQLARPRREDDVADLVGEHAAEVLAVIEPLDPLLSRLVDVDAVGVEEADDDGLGVIPVEADDEPAPIRAGADVEPRERKRRGFEVLDVQPRRVEPDDRGALQHPGRTRRVPRSCHRRAPRQRRGVRHRDPHDELGRQVDVGEARDPSPAEERACATRLPDNRARHRGVRLDDLVGVHLYARRDHSVVADPAVVAEHRPLADVHAAAQFARSPDDGAARRGASADVAVVVDDAAFEHSPLADVHVRTEHRVGAEARAGSDAAVVADQHRCLDRRRRVDLGPLADPDPVAQREGVDRDGDLRVKDVLVHPEIGLQRAHVFPVALGREPVERMTGVEERRENLGGEVDRAVRCDVVEDDRVEHVDAGVDAVREDLTPGRLLQEPFDSALGVGDDDPELERVLHRL